MGFRVTRLLGGLFSPQAVQPKRDESQKQSRQEQQPQHEKEREERLRQELSPEGLEKAIADFKKTKEFTQTGMSIDLIRLNGELQVRLSQADGSTVRVMPALDFLRLRESATDENSVYRGKILDQKF